MSVTFTSLWGTRRVKSVASKIGSGKTPTGGSETYAKEGIIFLRSQNIHFDGLRLDDVAFLDQATHRDMRATRVQPDDVLLNITGASLGRVARTPLSFGEANVNQHVCIIRPTEEVNSRYLAYALASRPGQEQIRELQAGGNREGLNFDQVGNLLLPAAPLEEQHRIADFLDTEIARINELIRLYRQLDKLAAERSQRVLDDAVGQRADLVPLRYIVRFREGPGIMAADFHPDGVPLIRISGLKHGEVTLNGCNFLDPAKVARQWSHFRLRMGDRLISGSATMGGVSVVQSPAVVGSVPYTGLIILRPAQANVEMNYVEAFLRSSSFSQQIDLLKTGATMQHFGPTHLSQVKAPLPSPDHQRRVATIAGEALHHASRCNRLAHHQISLLMERRQALITAAVTGQFDVSTASGRNVTEGVSV
ncbi:MULTISPECIES: restriction endonuclease subunit S [unclassified Streptomyces]|uniref:restriction endonuclease subunit S n=1 Tax=unclassified Streptomyces TaxID=2593676 RepID=UPI002E1E0C46